MFTEYKFGCIHSVLQGTEPHAKGDSTSVRRGIKMYIPANGEMPIGWRGGK